MWRVSHYERQGKSHKKNNVPCQDKTWAQANEDTIAIALADGAGSAKYSEDGAACATRCICALLLDSFTELYKIEDVIEVKTKILAVLRSALGKLADEMNCEIKDLASTLLACGIKDDKYLIIHIGDGVIGYLKDKKSMVASNPMNGEFTNETFFTTSQNVPLHMQLYKGDLGDISGFILMSDGTSNSLYNKKEQTLAPAVDNLFDWTERFTPETVRKNLSASFDLITKMSTDDCSVLVLKKILNPDRYSLNPPTKLFIN